MTVQSQLTAEGFTVRLLAQQSDEELRKIRRYFKSGEGEDFVGIRMGDVFDLAKQFTALPPSEIEVLLGSPVHEVRAGALRIMSRQMAAKSTGEAGRQALYELYLRRHDRINNWDLVDLGAPYVVGAYLLDRPRDVLYGLARSENPWERRTAIFSTLAFVRKGDVRDTMAIAELLINDPHDLVQKPTGGMLREAGKQDQVALLSFLDRYAATMPRTTLRYAIERLTPEQRKHYLALKNGTDSGR
jgi:3-methyladenine DNA glycosylase AlkD